MEQNDSGKNLTVRQGQLDPIVFVRAEQLPKMAEEYRLKTFRRWQAYSQQLRRDRSLLAYYDFQQKNASPSVLPNVAVGGDRAGDGVVENATWTIGRMPGKHALLFNGPSRLRPRESTTEDRQPDACRMGLFRHAKRYRTSGRSASE